MAIILFFLSGTVVLAHPLHLSVTNIVLENGTLSIELKTFRDDWETAYFHYHGKPVDFRDPEKREIPWFREYLEEQFFIAPGKDAAHLELSVDTLTLEEDNMCIRMSAAVPGETNSLYLYQALLTDIFPDQTNLVIFVRNGREIGIKFDWKKREEKLTLK